MDLLQSVLLTDSTKTSAHDQAGTRAGRGRPPSEDRVLHAVDFVFRFPRQMRAAGRERERPPDGCCDHRIQDISVKPKLGLHQDSECDKISESPKALAMTKTNMLLLKIDCDLAVSTFANKVLEAIREVECLHGVGAFVQLLSAWMRPLAVSSNLLKTAESATPQGS